MLFPEYLRHMVSVVINPKGTGKLNFARRRLSNAFFASQRTARVSSAACRLQCQGYAAGEGHSSIPHARRAPFSDTRRTRPSMPKTTPTIIEDTEEDEDEVDDVLEIEPESLTIPPRSCRNGNYVTHVAVKRIELSSPSKNQFYPIYIDEKAKKRSSLRGFACRLMSGPTSPRSRTDPSWPIDKERTIVAGVSFRRRCRS